MAHKKLKYWFDKELAKSLAQKISKEKNDFDSENFISAIESEIEGLELKPRIEVIARCIHRYLKVSFDEGIRILVRILGPENREETGMFTNFYWVMPIGRFVELYGLNHLELSLWAIEEITKRNTGEYAIRPFIEKYPAPTIEKMQAWSLNSNFHVRRLSCEGLRPRLPWARKLQLLIDDPNPIFPVLENLKDDPNRYVQKSVANCLNDVLKDNRSLGQETIRGWVSDARKERKWIIKHALRNLRKQNDPWALLVMNEMDR